jgi:3-hydroxybutyryl-CoA dehydrogenase
MESREIAPRNSIKTVGIVGCGLMGGGYAQLCAANDYTVLCAEVSRELLERGIAAIRMRLEEAVKAGQLTAERGEAVLGRISGVTDLDALSPCDLVIEAATEQMETKKKIFAALDAICAEDVILATNTSVLSVLDIAMATKRTDRVVGIHMNPLVFPLAEIVKTIATSEKTVQVAIAFSRSVGKGSVIAPDIPGFIANRLITPFLLNAIRMVEAGQASKEDIDQIFSQGMGWFMGPLTMLDAIGLDTVLLGAEAVYDESKDPQFAPPLLLKKMVTAGWLGMKSGKGFYEYGGR